MENRISRYTEKRIRIWIAISANLEESRVMDEAVIKRPETRQEKITRYLRESNLGGRNL